MRTASTRPPASSFSMRRAALSRSLVTGLDVDESANGYTVPGGFRNNAYGDRSRRRDARAASGQRQSAADRSADDHHRPHAHRQVQRGGRPRRRRDDGLLARRAAGAAEGLRRADPARSSSSDQIAGRNSCQHYNDFTAGDAAGHRRRLPGLRRARSPIPPPLPLTTGPLFGQDGVRVTAGASVQMSDDDDLVEPRPRRRAAPVCKRLRADTEQRPLLARQPRREQRQPAPRRRRCGSSARPRPRSRRATSSTTPSACSTRPPTASPTTSRAPVQAQNNWWGVRTGARDAADSRPSCVAERRRADADDATTRPSPRTRSTATSSPNASLPGGRLRLRLGQASAPTARARSPTSSAASTRSRDAPIATSDPTHLCERDAARPEHPDLRRVLQHRPRRPGHR